MQYATLFLSTIISMVLVKKTTWFSRVLPYYLAVMNMCTPAFWPVANFRITIYMAFGTLLGIFSNNLYDGETLFQHLVLSVCQFACLLYRLQFFMPYTKKHLVAL